MTLHCHSEHSFLDGRSRCREMAEAARANGDEALAKLADRAMDLQVTLQEGVLWVGEGERSVEITLVRLFGAGD